MMNKIVWVSTLVLGLAGVGVAIAFLPPGRPLSYETNDLLETISPFNSYGHVYDSDNIEAMRPRVMGTHGVIS
ncbi:uncharacterized protein METZ01_LOCUS292881, partial [marine metagenome]